MGPLLFIIYINDIENIDKNVEYFIYADDTAVFFKHHNPDELQYVINRIMPKISEWLHSNYLSLNASKTVYQLYTKRKSNVTIDIAINSIAIKRQDTVKYLGVLIDDDMKFISHINTITSTVSRNLGMIGRVRPFVGSRQLL